MKKKYVLDGEINGQPIRARSFLTRLDAEYVLGNMLTLKDLQVQDDRFPEPHTEEFVCNQYTRFFIRRVEA